MINSTGLLPNDRTHVLKFSGALRILRGLQAGCFALWQSGTPLSEWGGTTLGAPWYRLLQQRGTNGRTPALWDLNLRLFYELPAFASQIKPRLILDAFHVGSRRTPVNFEQIHYSNVDENGHNINPNPLYGKASRFQPPMALRLGMEIDF